MSFSQRQKKYLTGMAFTLIASIAVGIVLRVIITTQSHRTAPALMLIVLALLSVAAIATAIPWWRASDEMQKEAQLAGWYWGGTVGAVLGVSSAFVAGGLGSEMVRGAVLVCGVQFACFVICWTGWRILHRPRGA